MKQLLILIALALLLAPVCAHATTVNGTFGGTIDRMGVVFDGSGGWAQTDFGLGINQGDGFAGNFVYNTTGGSDSFTVTVGGGPLLTVTSAATVVGQPFDGYITYFYLIGQLSGGLYMSVALTNGRDQVAADGPPQYLNSDDWYAGCFKVGPQHRPGIADDCWLTDDSSIVGASFGNPSTRPDSDFYLRATSIIDAASPLSLAVVDVPEPSALLLLVVGLIGAAVFARSRGQAGRNPHPIQ